MNYALKNIKDIRTIMASIRRNGGSVLTNYYNQCNHLDIRFKTWTSSRAIVFEWIDLGIKRIYFYATDEKELTELLSLVDVGSVIDFITKDKNDLRQVFQKANYRLHLEYGRFCVKPRTKQAQELYDLVHDEDVFNQVTKNDLYGEPALIEDAETIDRQLREEFDPFEAHFYSLEQLRENIKKGWVWVARKDGEIIAANLFEIQGRKAYGAYLYNRGNIDVLCSLIANTDNYVAKLGVTYSYCWMRLTNKRIIRYNMKYNGYVPDGVFDMIYIKE